MIQKTIRRFGMVLPLVAVALFLTAATSTDSVARKHKTGRKASARVHSRSRHGKIAQSTHRASSRHGKYLARLSRHHHTPQRPLTTTEKAEIVEKIRTLARTSSGDSVLAAEAKSTDVQSQIAEAAKEEQAEDGVDSTLDQFLKTRAAASPKNGSGSDDYAFDPAAEVMNEQDFTLSLDQDHAAARSDVMAEIINWIGTRYVFGGDDRCGIDCSAFTRAVFDKAFGLELPRTAWEQSQLGESVDKTQLQFGDLVFFKTAGYAPITHVGIYIGAGLFANAACSRGVTVASLESEYWSKHFVEAKRIVSSDGEAMNMMSVTRNAISPSSGTVAAR